MYSKSLLSLFLCSYSSCLFFPLQVLSGWVRSVEDHGYIVDFGVADKVGFLLNKHAAQFIKTCNRGRQLVVGQVIRCKVLSAVDTRSVPVSAEPGVVGGALVGGDSLVQLHALQPGLLVNTAVKDVSCTDTQRKFRKNFAVISKFFQIVRAPSR